MKVTITENQFKRMIDNSNRWGLIGINEDRYQKLSPEDEDKKIEKIINSIKNNEEFPFINQNLEYAWLNREEKKGKQKFKDALDKIRLIKKYKENERIGRIITTVRETGTIPTKSTDYGWLDSGARRGNEKFKNVLNQIEKIKEDLENKRIGEILNTVKTTGKYNKDDFEWLRIGKRRVNDSEKFENAINKIREIEEHFENNRIVEIINSVKKTGVFSSKSPDYKWLDNGARKGNEKFKNILNKIKKILEVQGKIREWWGEKTIKQILDGMDFTDIPSLGQYTIKDCKNSLTCREYKFDVYLPYNETNYNIIKNMPTKHGEPEVPELQQTGIIFEYDGRQHFEASDFFGGEEAFIERIHNDREKNSYCKNKTIKLVRIPYTSKTREDIERDVVSALKNPSTFILTGDYPKKGWNAPDSD